MRSDMAPVTKTSGCPHTFVSRLRRANPVVPRVLLKIVLAEFSQLSLNVTNAWALRGLRLGELRPIPR